jgi:hypothetical protein
MRSILDGFYYFLQGYVAFSAADTYELASHSPAQISSFRLSHGLIALITVTVSMLHGMQTSI